MKFTSGCVLLLAGLASLSALGQAPVSQLPDGPNRETAQRICSGCHSVQMFLGRGMTREQWGGVVSNMIGRGAKIGALSLVLCDVPPGTVAVGVPARVIDRSLAGTSDLPDASYTN